MHAKVQEFILIAKADPKKAGVLGVLALVLVVLGGRQLIGSSPREAHAGEEAVAQVREQALGLSDIESVVRSGPSVRVPRAEDGLRDLFRFDERHFPLPEPESGDGATSGKSDGGSDETSGVDADTRGDPGASIREEAERFRLTSTLLGSNPIASISYREGTGEGRSHMLRIGEAFKGFTLVSVSHRQAVIEKAGQRFTLRVEDTR